MMCEHALDYRDISERGGGSKMEMNKKKNTERTKSRTKDEMINDIQHTTPPCPPFILLFTTRHVDCYPFHEPHHEIHCELHIAQMKAKKKTHTHTQSFRTI